MGLCIGRSTASSANAQNSGTSNRRSSRPNSSSSGSLRRIGQGHKRWIFRHELLIECIYYLESPHYNDKRRTPDSSLLNKSRVSLLLYDLYETHRILMIAQTSQTQPPNMKSMNAFKQFSYESMIQVNCL